MAKTILGGSGQGLGADPVVRLGRVALATQGSLYVVVGLLAVQVSNGDSKATPSQRGALANLGHQPFGKVLLAVAALGLFAYCGWRVMLVVRGEPGNDEDGKSVIKRLANAGRAAVYGSLAFFAVRLVFSSKGASSSGSGGDTQQKSTSTVLGWPGGRVLVVIVGLGIVGAGLWNIYKGVTRKFEDNLNLARLDEPKQKLVKTIGLVGYAARGVAFALIGWFLITAGLAKNSGKTKGLDGSLRMLAERPDGHFWLFLVAIGLLLFGAFRILDGVFRKPSEIAHS